MWNHELNIYDQYVSRRALHPLEAAPRLRPKNWHYAYKQETYLVAMTCIVT